MSTLSDIRKKATFVGEPWAMNTTGFFAVPATLLGVSTTYVLMGELGDEEALIVGRSEVHGRRAATYLGDGLKGGSWEGSRTISDLPLMHLASLSGAPDPEPYVGWSGRRYSVEASSWAAEDDGPVAFEPRSYYGPTEDER